LKIDKAFGSTDPKPAALAKNAAAAANIPSKNKDAYRERHPVCL